jgi:hypothetical protein
MVGLSLLGEEGGREGNLQIGKIAEAINSLPPHLYIEDSLL